MEFFIEVVVSILGLCIVVGVPSFLIYTWIIYERGYPLLDFKSFKKFYALNPNRWQCDDTYVECRVDTCYYERFNFNILDFYQYRMWNRRRMNMKQQEKSNKSIQRMMDAVKIDIANSEAEAKKAQAKLMEELRKQCNESEDTLFDLMKLVEEYKEKIW